MASSSSSASPTCTVSTSFSVVGSSGAGNMTSGVGGGNGMPGSGPDQARPKRYAALRAQILFSQEQTSVLFYKEQNDLKKALRKSLLEAKTSGVSGGTVEKESDQSDQSDQARPKRYAALRAQILFSQEQTSVLFYKEQNDLKKALRKSLREAKRAANRADRIDGSTKYVNGVYKGDKSRSEDSEGHSHPDDDQHSNKDSQSNDSTSSKSKKLKIHAQRKFASSSVNNITASSPVKSTSKNYNTVAELFPRHRPSTEDFLTFLCFRSTKLLPPINGSYNCTD